MMPFVYEILPGSAENLRQKVWNAWATPRISIAPYNNIMYARARTLYICFGRK